MPLASYKLHNKYLLRRQNEYVLLKVCPINQHLFMRCWIIQRGTTSKWQWRWCSEIYIMRRYKYSWKLIRSKPLQWDSLLTSKSCRISLIFVFKLPSWKSEIRCCPKAGISGINSGSDGGLDMRVTEHKLRQI